ncbi:valine--tRNA ligase, mitochondrial 1-like [Nicotiana tabacum]|uniref:valine--tRNA ligase n=1 Tax=Nicotiana tabacum TaxID=4097 RepID=A0A1S4D1Z9_TOBAC|nr:PREDICTED: valine--tRNA ligase, mitochondrial 1-like [Nicotiana tabacum]
MSMFFDVCSFFQSWNNDSVEAEMEKVSSIVKGLRSKRTLLPPKERFARLEAFVLCRTTDTVETINKRKMEICTLATLSSLKVSSDSDATPTRWLTKIVDDSVTVFLEEKGTTSNSETEVERLEKKREETRK